MISLDRRIHQSIELIKPYNGSLPLGDYLRNHFRQHKKFGGRDRRELREIVFSWFRFASLFRPVKLTAKSLEHALYINSLELLEKYKAAGLDVSVESLSDRLELLEGIYGKAGPSFIGELDLTENLNPKEFAHSLCSPKKPAIRIYRDSEELSTLLQANGPVETIFNGKGALLDKPRQITESVPWKKGEFELKDQASQHIGFELAAGDAEHWFDCCAGSGGKSIDFLHRNPDATLDLFDIRKSMRVNAAKRLNRHAFGKRMTILEEWPTNTSYYGVIADVPCSGSGTWRSNPDRAYHFKTSDLSFFTTKQRSILENAAKLVKPKGQLVYITCSVFKEENELQCDFIEKDLKLKHINTITANYLAKGGDFLFLATFEKS